MGNLVAALGVGAGALALDTAGKQFARANVDLYHPGDVRADAVMVGPFGVVHSRNEHIARGLLPEPIEKPVAIAGMPLTIGGLAWAGSKGGRSGAIGAGLAAAGVLGNSGEFALRGYVTDYIGIPGLPITPNLSDVALLAGAGTVALSSFRSGSPRRAAGVLGGALGFAAVGPN